MTRIKYWIADALMCFECLRFRFEPKHIRYCGRKREAGR